MPTQESPQFFYFVPNQPQGPAGKPKSFNSKGKTKTGRSSATKRNQNGGLSRNSSSTQQKVLKNQNANNRRLSNNKKKLSAQIKRSSSSQSTSSGLWTWLVCSCTTNAHKDIVDSSRTSEVSMNDSYTNISQASMSIGDDNNTLHPKSSTENLEDDDNSEIFQQLEDAGQVNFDGTAEFGAHGLNSRNTSAYNTFGFLDDASSIPNSRNVSIYRMTSDDSGASQLECSTDTEVRQDVGCLSLPVVHSNPSQSVQQIDPVYALSASSSFDAVNNNRSTNLPQPGIQLGIKTVSLESVQKDQADYEEEKPQSPAVRELLRNSNRSVEPIRPATGFNSSINNKREPNSPNRRSLHINVHTEDELEQVEHPESITIMPSPLPTEPNTADSSLTSPATASSSVNNNSITDEHLQPSSSYATISPQQQQFNQITPPSNVIQNHASPIQLPQLNFHQHYTMPVQQHSPSQIMHTVQKRQNLSIAPNNNTTPPYPTVNTSHVNVSDGILHYPEFGRYETSSADSDNDSQSITLSIQSSVFDASLAPSLQVTPSNAHFGGFFRGGSFTDAHHQHSPNMSRVASALISPPQSYYGNGNSWYVASTQSPQPPQNASSNTSVNSSASIEQAIQASLEEERLRREQELEYRRAVELALQQSLVETNSNSNNNNNATIINGNSTPAVMSPPTREHYDLIQHRMRLEQQRRIQLLQAMARQMDIDVNSASGNSGVESVSEGGGSYNDNSGISINSATIAVGDILPGEPSVYGNYSHYR